MDFNIDMETLKTLQPLIVSYTLKVVAVFLVFVIGKWFSKKITGALVRLLESRVLSRPAPLVAVSELAESSVNPVIRPWVATDNYWDLYFSLIETIKITFDQRGISFSYPQRDVHLLQLPT